MALAGLRAAVAGSVDIWWLHQVSVDFDGAILLDRGLGRCSAGDKGAGPPLRKARRSVLGGSRVCALAGSCHVVSGHNARATHALEDLVAAAEGL